MRISPHVETGIVAGEAVSGNYAHSMVNTPLQRAQRTGSGVRLRATRSAQLGHTAWGPPSIHSRGTTDQRLGRTSTISSWLRGKIMAFFRTSSTASSPAALSTTYHAPRRSGVRPAPVNLAHRLVGGDRKSTRLNSSHSQISYAVFCLKKKKSNQHVTLSCDIDTYVHAGP